jgi:hypothetical protein
MYVNLDWEFPNPPDKPDPPPADWRLRNLTDEARRLRHDLDELRHKHATLSGLVEGTLGGLKWLGYLAAGLLLILYGMWLGGSFR